MSAEPFGRDVIIGRFDLEDDQLLTNKLVNYLSRIVHVMCESLHLPDIS